MSRPLGKRCPTCGFRKKDLKKHLLNCRRQRAPWEFPLRPRPRIAAPPDRTNLYRCACGWELVTIDIHVGTTWAMEECKACGGNAMSAWYSQKAVAGREPSHEFYMPTPEEFAKLDPLEKDHCAKGGLLLRKRVVLSFHGEPKP